MARSVDRTDLGHYDRAYYDHWYRDQGFGSPARLERKVRYALGAAEYLLDRPVRTVLDVGCGEGPWLAELRRHRPGVRYVGVDPSEYAVARYGTSRNLRAGSLGDLHALGLDAEVPGGRFDLVVCVDVIAYVPDAELRRGLRTIGRLLGGLALIEVFTAADEFEGDRVHYHPRPPATYDRWFRAGGLRRIGPHLYAARSLLDDLATFEQR